MKILEVRNDPKITLQTKPGLPGERRKIYEIG
jgi:hypothetical protein